MPRTKYSRKPKISNESLEEYDMMMKSFERHVRLRISKLERDAQSDIKSFETFIDVMVSRLPSEIRQMTLSEIFFTLSDNEKENCNEVSSSVKDFTQKSQNAVPRPQMEYKIKRATAASDDGYVTESATSSVGSTSQAVKTYACVSTTRKTRSSSRASKIKLNEINQKTVAKLKVKGRSNDLDTFKTPLIPKLKANAYDVVTPKIQPNTPLNVLRRPRQGEMVLSMQGSPLLVSAVVEEKTANINVPLANGSVMSLLPQDGLRMSHIPPLDSETMHQLKTLKNHIEKVIAFK